MMTMRQWKLPTENVDFICNTCLVTLLYSRPRLNTLRYLFCKTLNAEKKKNIWQEKVVTSSYFETSENELAGKLPFLFTFSAHLIENEPLQTWMLQMKCPENNGGYVWKHGYGGHCGRIISIVILSFTASVSWTGSQKNTCEAKCMEIFSCNTGGRFQEWKPIQNLSTNIHETFVNNSRAR